MEVASRYFPWLTLPRAFEIIAEGSCFPSAVAVFVFSLEPGFWLPEGKSWFLLGQCNSWISVDILAFYLYLAFSLINHWFSLADYSALTRFFSFSLQGLACPLNIKEPNTCVLRACCSPEKCITCQIILHIVGTVHVRVKYWIDRHRYL